MVSSNATSVGAYLSALSSDRREALSAVRAVILENLPPGFEEGMQYGMIAYFIPLSRYPDTYNGQPLTVACLASQKQYMSVYLMGCYGAPASRRWFESAWRKAGKKLDMGKSCVRFKKLEDLSLDVLGQVIARVTPEQLIAEVEKAHGGRAKKRAKATSSRKTATAKAPAAKVAPTKAKKSAKATAKTSKRTAAKKPGKKAPARARVRSRA